jgi:hypothetical protein
MAHLMDQSFSSDHLHGWLRAKVKEYQAATPADRLAAILRAGSGMAGRAPVEYTVIVPFRSIPGGVVRHARASDRFYNFQQMLSCLDERGIEHPPIREGGGALSFVVTAREPRSAVIATELDLRRLRARCVVGDRGERPKDEGIALVLNATRPQWTSLPAHTGAVFLPTLRDHSGLLPGQAASLNAIDDALELLAAVETTSSWASVSALWAALEGLLSRPAESGALAADRAAELVACSFPRAELNTLLDRVQELEVIPEPMDPHQYVLARVSSGHFEVDSAADAAAIQRVKQMQRDPHGVLNRMKGYFADSFRRLYNQRNLVLHSGRFDSVSLPLTMRTLPPLTGAAVDRIIHGLAAGTATSATSLAARASNELQLVGRPGGRDITVLLD